MAKTVVIKNPTAIKRIVSLKFEQKIELRLSKDIYVNPQVVPSGNIKIAGIYEDGVEVVYTIAMADQDYLWSFYSSCFMGEVWVFSENKDVGLAKLCIVLQTLTEEKQHVLTVVNPDFYDIRLKPHNVLEVIAFDAGFSEVDNWEYCWEPKGNLALMDLGWDEIKLDGYSQVYPDKDCGSLFKKLHRYSNPSKAIQHHFWFRLSKEVIDLMGQNINSDIFIGNLIIKGQCWDNFVQYAYKQPPIISREYRAALYLDCDKKYKSDYLETAKIRRQVPSYVKYPTNFVVKKSVPSIKDVTLTNKQSINLSDGCRVVSCVTTGLIKKDEFDFEVPLCSGFRSWVPLSK